MKIIQNLIAGGAGLFAFIYLMMPSLIPDVLPIVGAMDEMVATTILIASFSYFGLDVTRLFGRASVSRKNSDDVIEVEAVREQAK